jgi:hypothetical protein
MSDFIPKPGAQKIGGLGPKAQKLQALREKAVQAKSGAKPKPDASSTQAKGKELAGAKKVSFQRKAV